MQIYYKNRKTYTDNTFPKILIFISKKKIKEKSKCAICLTDRTFFNKRINEYDLEQLLKPFSFIDACYKRTWKLVV